MPTSKLDDRLRRPTVRLGLPLQLLLPLLTTVVVMGVLATMLILSSRTLKSTALEQAQDRLNRSVRQLVAVSATGLQTARARYNAVAHDPIVRRAVTASARSPAPDTVRRLLERLVQPNDSGLPVELWTSSGRRVAVVGDQVPHTINDAARPEIPSPERVSPPREGLDSIKAVDSLQLGNLYEANGRVLFWFVMPIVANDSVVGYLLHQRRLAANPQTEQSLRELSGTSVAAYYRNINNGLWTTLSGRPATAPAFGPDRSIVAEEIIQGTPLALVLELPRHSVVTAPAALIRKLTLLAGALSVVGAMLIWLIARQTTRPLVVLNKAAESVARGNYTARVPTDGPEEIARLSASFNHMAEQIGGTAAELEQRETEFRALANAIPQLAWMADANGSIYWYNQRWYDYTGTTFETMAGWGWQSVHDASRLPEVLSRWRDAIRLGQRFEMEYTLRGADGVDRWFLTRVEPVRAVRGRAGEIVRWFGTNTDIQDLREARESARAASRAKSDFLATMSHELRTPLNAISGYVQLLEMELRGPITDAQRRDLGRIRASQEHLLGLISGILDLSRIESGKVSFDVAEVAVDPLLASLDALVGPQAAAKQLVLEYPRASADLTVIGDQEKLRQILLNLLSNAIRYTPAGGRIVMTASAADDRTVAITVSDNGPGIRADRHADIFEPFVQLDRSLTRTRDGVGLGLSISRDLARWMNGELSVESAPGQGACFTLTLLRGTGEVGGAYRRTGEVQAVL